MLLLLQVVLYCLLLVVLIKCEVKNDGLNCLCFYPPEFRAKAQERGLADEAAAMKKGKRFLARFCFIMLAVLLLTLSFWNRVPDFKTAYFQAALFLVAANWFDGIVLDRLWVGHSRLWRIAGMEDVPYIKPWKTVLVRRTLATVLYLILALAVAGAAAALAQTVL